MAQHKYVGRYARNGVQSKNVCKKKLRLTFISMVLLLSVVVGGSLAYIIAQTDHIQNQFTPASVTCQVNNGKNVTNTGNVDAYIRAAIVVNWMDEQGNIFGIAPASGEYTLTVNTTYWTKDTSTNFYYYNHSVAPTGTTEDLITSFDIADDVDAPEGYELCAEVVAEAIQADGDTDTDDGAVPAYQDAWSVTLFPGS